MVQKKNFRIIAIATGMMISGVAFQNCSYDPGIAQAHTQARQQKALNETGATQSVVAAASTDIQALTSDESVKPVRVLSASSPSSFETQD